ncbi:OLC1v1037882C1 [Oldenlandia corymbosa var. corymbosa]|uniref:OLC1v1037882C1 n=1 Tax=Oldenlandia corymbosa var. corymbosa TaxID=529605 RepID=A0AAV1D270_OLDCO|nr:OLC1v1037882C1 [Oldenlandia corymbosa var. corymbosa]
MAADRYSSAIVTSQDENNLFVDLLQEAPLYGHRKPTSILGSVFYCILLASYAIFAAGATLFIHTRKELMTPLLCSSDVILLVVTGIFQQYLVYQVQKIRLQGYYVFSQKLKHIIRLPFTVLAYGTAAMLLIIVWESNVDLLSKHTILRIIMLAEAIFAGFFVSVYMGYVHQNNAMDSEPDVLKSLYSPLLSSNSVEGLRYHEGGRLSDQQMALLQYQRENIHFLSEEILRLQECLSKYGRSSDGNTPQVDLAHLLAARDQELRTVSAEMNQLQSELSLARSLIAERDSELQSLRSTNNQYVEENERLRAILGEWSTRAAKLERALEIERLSNLELQKKLATLKSQSRESMEPSL